MMVNLTAIAYAARQHYAAQGHPYPLSNGHAQQLIAAALGYGTLAALQVTNDAHLAAEAAHVVVDADRLHERAKQLELPDPEQAAKAAVAGLKEVLPGAVHWSPDDFVQALQEFVDDRTPEEGEVASQMAMTNASLDEVYMPIEGLEDFDLEADVNIDGSISVGIEGHVSMDQDPDRVYYGDRIEVEATLMVDSMGKRLFREPVLEVTSAQLQWFGDDGREDRPQQVGQAPQVALARALAELLEIPESDAEGLDYEEEQNTSSDGLLYSIELRFERTASPEIADRIRVKHPTLRVQVSPNFFDDVVMPN